MAEAHPSLEVWPEPPPCSPNAGRFGFDLGERWQCSTASNAVVVAASSANGRVACRCDDPDPDESEPAIVVYCALRAPPSSATARNSPTITCAPGNQSKARPPKGSRRRPQQARRLRRVRLGNTAFGGSEIRPSLAARGTRIGDTRIPTGVLARGNRITEPPDRGGSGRRVPPSSGMRAPTRPTACSESSGFEGRQCVRDLVGWARRGVALSVGRGGNLASAAERTGNVGWWCPYRGPARAKTRCDRRQVAPREA
jgi:hypothetical protein